MMRTTGAKSKRKKSRSLFIFLMLFWPVLQFILTQFLNINMVIMAFNDYTFGVNDPVFVGLDNFKGLFRLFSSALVDNEGIAVKNTIFLFFFSLLVCMPGSLIFSYLIYIKVKGHKWLQKLIYLPCVTSTVVLVIVFKNFMQGPLSSIYGILGISDKIPLEGWLGPNTAWNTIIIFSIWTGFSSNLIYFLSAMRRIPEDLIEAAKLDGASEVRIFSTIIMPLISSTIWTLISLLLAGIMGWAMPSLLMMGDSTGMYGTGTVGLSIMRFTTAKAYGVGGAYGILLTLVGAPLTLLLRKLADKFEVDVQF